MSSRTPVSMTAAAAVGACLLALPLLGVLVRAPWSDLGPLLTSHDTLTALRLSLECSLGALAISLVLGVPLAWLLARRDFAGKGVLRALVTVPLVLPPVVGGVALLLAFGRRGLVPLHLAFTTWGAMAAEAFVAMPFLVLTVEGAIASLDDRYEHVAATLGSSPLSTFRRVTLPLVMPGVAAGAALAWARALGEFGATITFAGNLPGQTQTLPLDVYTTLDRDPDAAVALSLVLLVLSAAVLVALRDRWRVSGR
ncbi:MAG TPA: ABC transporter permease [Mycobacteriales bacterium]|jgi:molybdate transport system permease protein|nr:ABC transporter permease [Mycobacteriales bacterium]